MTVFTTSFKFFPRVSPLYQKSVFTSYDSDNEVFSDILTDDGSACIDNLHCGGLRVWTCILWI